MFCIVSLWPENSSQVWQGGLCRNAASFRVTIVETNLDVGDLHDIQSVRSTINEPLAQVKGLVAANKLEKMFIHE